MGFVANYLANLSYVWLGREPSRPLLFSWYVTHRCELACRYCSDGDGRPFVEDGVDELSAAEAQPLLRLLRAAGDTLDVTGGEPLLRPDLEDLLASARSLGFRTILNTKGVGLEARPQVLRLTDVLVLSVDALDPERLAQQIGRPPVVAARILDTLRWAAAARSPGGPKLVLSAVATPANLRDVRAVLEFALEHGLGFQLSPEIQGTRANPALAGNPEYHSLVDHVLALKRRNRGILGVPSYYRGIRDLSAFRCRPLLMPVIRPDGRLVYPCLERKEALVDVLAAGSYAAALQAARRQAGAIPDCSDECQIFCHMGLSLFQAHPGMALRELRHWSH
jgi:MoaA/NifB/PqqE/SkfB family radical SAM enzyme